VCFLKLFFRSWLYYRIHPLCNNTAFSEIDKKSKAVHRHAYACDTQARGRGGYATFSRYLTGGVKCWWTAMQCDARDSRSITRALLYRPCLVEGYATRIARSSVFLARPIPRMSLPRRRFSETTPLLSSKFLASILSDAPLRPSLSLSVFSIDRTVTLASLSHALLGAL